MHQTNATRAAPTGHTTPHTQSPSLAAGRKFSYAAARSANSSGAKRQYQRRTAPRNSSGAQRQDDQMLRINPPKQQDTAKKLFCPVATDKMPAPYKPGAAE